MEDLAVEVIGENTAYYKACITDVHKDEVTVAFENDWHPESKFPYHRVRLAPAAPTDDKPVSMTEGQEIEVFSRGNEEDACGWWRVLVKMIKGEFYVVEYLGLETTFTEIVPIDRLRLKNTNQPITKDTFHRFEIPVPEDMQEYFKAESAHKEFQKMIGAAVCKYNTEKKCLQIIGRHGRLKKKAYKLSDVQFCNIRQKVMLLDKLTQEVVKETHSMLEYAKESVQVPRMLVVNRSVDSPLHGSASFLEHATQTEMSHPLLMKDVSTSTDAEKSNLLETLSENLISFYDNKTNTDCVIKVGKSQFPVHRAVISARSAVFAAMFNHDTKEKLNGEVDIPDIEPTTLSDILFYVYSGKIRGLTHDTAVSMYTFADKYALCELRDMCLEVLLNCLTTENVCDAAVLAHTHGETTLENKVIHFIADRLEEFMESDKWRQFAHDKCLLANRLLCSALIASKKKNIEGKC